MPTPSQRLQDSLLYAITPSRPPAGDLNEFLPAVLEAGVDIVQLRDKHLEGGLLLPFCEIVRRRTTEFGALFVVNDRVDLALAAGADGVHLGQDDLPPAAARAQMGETALIGLSTHSPEQIIASIDQQVDYCAVGPVFATPTKPGRPAVGTGLVRFSSTAGDRPIFAIGGIGTGNIEQVLAAGAGRICVVRALTEATDPGRVARILRGALTGT